MFNAENLKFYFYAQRQPRPQGFSLKKWVGKPWGRGWLKDTVDRFFCGLQQITKDQRREQLTA